MISPDSDIFIQVDLWECPHPLSRILFQNIPILGVDADTGKVTPRRLWALWGACGSGGFL